jgi:CRP-like cAMP-binding protein
MWRAHIAELPHANQLIRMLSPEAVQAMGPLERVTVPMRSRLDEPEAVFFLEDGVASVVTDVEAKWAIELGIVGKEGLVGLNVVYGDDADPFHVIMQVEGAALRADADKVREAIGKFEEIRRVFLLYARAFSIQVATTALANGRAKLDERLVRWLLMVQDRVGTTFPITHDFISVMLGVRRLGVTLAVHMLEGDGLIRAARGTITIIDRDGLVSRANGSYGFAEVHYRRLLGEVF